MQFTKITKIKLELLLTELSLAPEAPSFFDKHVCPRIDAHARTTGVNLGQPPKSVGLKIQIALPDKRTDWWGLLLHPGDSIF